MAFFLKVRFVGGEPRSLARSRGEQCRENGLSHTNRKRLFTTFAKTMWPRNNGAKLADALCEKRRLSWRGQQKKDWPTLFADSLYIFASGTAQLSHVVDPAPPRNVK